MSFFIVYNTLLVSLPILSFFIFYIHFFVFFTYPFFFLFFFFSSRRRHTRLQGDWSSDVCSSDLEGRLLRLHAAQRLGAVMRQRHLVVLAGEVDLQQLQVLGHIVHGQDVQRRQAAADRATLGQLVLAHGQGQAHLEHRAHAHGAVQLDAAAHELRSEEHTSELQSPCNLVCRL